MADMGNVFVIAAPSGTGKTTLVKALVDSIPKLTVSISHTTRAKRPNEMHGINYYFVEKETFLQMVAHDDFLEHAIIFDQHYGTSKSYVRETLAKGIDVILEIDWQGHQQIKRLFPETISIFILPPSLNDLQDRLVKRNQDNKDIIKKRLSDAKVAISHFPEFDYAVVNDDFDHALVDLKTIVMASRLKLKRQTTKLDKIIKDLGKV